MVSLLALAPAQQLASAQEPSEGATAWLFFAPDAPPEVRVVEQLRLRSTLPIRPALLVRNFSVLSEVPSREFQVVIKALRDMSGPDFGLALHDESGLSAAKRFGLTRLPAVVVERGGRAHLAYGADADVEALLQCE